MAPALPEGFGPYREVATAPGAWWMTLHLHPAPSFAQLRQILTGACGTWVPITAYVPMLSPRMTEVTLIRDSSITHGTPTVDAAISAGLDLAEDQGWSRGAGIHPAAGVLVGLGLREGYQPGAPAHPASDVTRRLREHGTGWHAQPSRLVSARRTSAAVEWYSEPGLIITARRDLLPAIADAAHAIRQHRFCVTDLDQDRTYALATTTRT